MTGIKFLGVDPGLTGGLAVLSDTRTFGTIIPTYNIEVKTKRGLAKRKRYDLPALRRFFSGYTMDVHVHTTLEEQFPMPQQGVTSMYSVGLGYGIFQGLLIGLNMKYMTVHPKKWQAMFGIGMKQQQIGGVILNTKEQALLVCEDLFPDVNLMASERSTMPHKGIIDALLLAEYGRRKMEEKKNGLENCIKNPM